MSADTVATAARALVDQVLPHLRPWQRYVDTQSKRGDVRLVVCDDRRISIEVKVGDQWSEGVADPQPGGYNLMGVTR
jgi:hypothetical protein